MRGRFLWLPSEIPHAVCCQRLGEIPLRWLTEKTDVPEIRKVWPLGAIIPIKIEVASSTRAGADLDVRVVLTNNKAGHSFPAGPLNIVRVWIELEVYDKAGNKVFHSGELHREKHVAKGRRRDF